MYVYYTLTRDSEGGRTAGFSMQVGGLARKGSLVRQLEARHVQVAVGQDGVVASVAGDLAAVAQPRDFRSGSSFRSAQQRDVAIDGTADRAWKRLLVEVRGKG